LGNSQIGLCAPKTSSTICLPPMGRAAAFPAAHWWPSSDGRALARLSHCAGLRCAYVRPPRSGSSFRRTKGQLELDEKVSTRLRAIPRLALLVCRSTNLDEVFNQHIRARRRIGEAGARLWSLYSDGFEIRRVQGTRLGRVMRLPAVTEPRSKAGTDPQVSVGRAHKGTSSERSSEARSEASSGTDEGPGCHGVSFKGRAHVRWRSRTFSLLVY